MEYPVRTRQWTRAEYDRLIEIGVFRPGDPVELLGGQLVVAEPQSEAHYTAVGLAEDALRLAFGPGWLIRSQGPIALDEESEPEPDIAVAPGRRREWIVNLAGRTLEVYRQPVADASAPFGWRYASTQTLGVEASVAPLAAPDARISVAGLLP